MMSLHIVTKDYIHGYVLLYSKIRKIIQLCHFVQSSGASSRNLHLSTTLALAAGVE